MYIYWFQFHTFGNDGFAIKDVVVQKGNHNKTEMSNLGPVMF